MSKGRISVSDAVIVGILFLMLLGWGPFYDKFLAPPPPPPGAAPSESLTNAATAGAGGNLPATVPLESRSGTNATQPPAMGEGTVTGQTAGAAAPSMPEIRRPAPDRVAKLTNDLLSVALSPYGGCILDVELKKYGSTVKRDSQRVVLDFGRIPALAYEGLPGLDIGGDFGIETGFTNKAAVRLTACTAEGVRLIRTVTIEDNYRLLIEDVFVNTGSAPVAVPSHRLWVGSMAMQEGESAIRGMVHLGIDTLASVGGEGVKHWARLLPNYFQEESRRGRGCAWSKPRQTKPLLHSIRQEISTATDWVAVKNKFFVQILAPEGGADGCLLTAFRMVSATEDPARSETWAAMAALDRVSSAMLFAGRTLAPGESFQHRLRYYVGPKEFSLIRHLGNHQDEVMEFGKLKLLCQGLLWSLNRLHVVIPNYGVAIILLTLIIRAVFWPVTHRGTESMKRMQELQPKIVELREKYKDKPQKLQQETMALYKEHKVNPLGGCLPMLIQIPVFFALYNVLRSAIELRFAGFLWIRDLSEPENLLQGMIPLVGSLNILPIFTAFTQAWQTKLTPSGGDPSQQKMMMFMPVVMIFIFYSMPSALNLYWSANQVLMIGQLLWQKRKSRARGA